MNNYDSLIFVITIINLFLTLFIVGILLDLYDEFLKERRRR